MERPATNPIFSGDSISRSPAALRIRIVESAIDVFRQHALHESSPELVAAKAGMPLSVLTTQFPSWNGLILTAIDRWNIQRMKPIHPIGQAHGAVAFLRGLVDANIEDPAFMRLIAATINIAATPDHPMSELLRQDYRDFRSLVQQQLTRDIREGREPDGVDPALGAEQLIALYEGLQLQYMLRTGMDLVASFDQAVSYLRDGWTHPYRTPTWDSLTRYARRGAHSHPEHHDTAQ